MMRRILSVIIVLAMLLSCVGVCASALQSEQTDLPFEPVAPANVTAVWENGYDSPTSTTISYSLSNAMTTFYQQKSDAVLNETIEEFMAQYNYDDVWITTQVDWAVDDVYDTVSGWHCNEYWNADNGFGYDEDGRYRVGEWDLVDAWVGNATETVNTHLIFRWISEDAYNGNPDEGIPGIKDQLNADQYTYTYDEEAEEYVFRINFDEHTAYFRMRFVFTTVKDTDDGTQFQYYYSDWSNTTAIGKDAVAFEPLTKDDLPAPAITGLRMTDEEFNDNPVVAFTLTVPDELAANTAMLEAYGGYIYIDTEARVEGDTQWTGLQGDWIIKAGEMKMALFSLVNDNRPIITKDTVIELRCRYRCGQPGYDDEIYSDWSKIISFGTDDITAGPHYQDDLVFEVQEVEEKRIAGLTVPVNIDLTKNNGYISGWLEVTWDNTAFALASVDYTDIAPMNTAVLDPEDTDPPVIENTGSYRIYIGDHITQGLENFTDLGTALTLNFEILPEATVGEYPIEISDAEFQQTDLEAGDLHVAGVAGSIRLTLFELLLGDVDLDGVVTIFDASAIQKSLAHVFGFPNYEKIDKTKVVFRIADVDGDGKVSIFDASAIQKHLAKVASVQGYGIGKPMQ